VTEGVQIALIAAIPASLAAIVGVINALKLGKVEQKVDGRLTELLELTRESSKALGAKEQKERTER
jgi:predicted outer membrane lipoprotein